MNMRYKEKNIDMAAGPLCRNILFFTFPIALSSMLQQLFTAADTAIVGFFDTPASLAAVGTNGEIIALIVSLSSGLAVGVNVFLAQQLGQKKDASLTSITQTALALSVIIGVIGLSIGQCIAVPLLSLIKTPTDILAPSALYLKLYFCSYPFLMLYDFGSAILRAHGNSRYPFIALTLSGIVNILLNLIFVVLARLGIAGVAVATVLSTMLSAVLVIHRLRKDDPGLHLPLYKWKITSGFILPVLKVGIPSAVQGAVFCFANIFVQASINSFGSYAIAGSTISMNFEYFAYYIITAFGQTATTFISLNYAAGQLKRCRKILWICTIFSILSSLLVIEPLILFRGFFTGIFSAEREVLAHACLRMMCILFFEPLCSLYEIPAGALRGTGHALYPAAATVTGTCCFRILWICSIFKQYNTLNILYIAFPVSWILTIGLIWVAFIVIKPLRH